MLPCIVRHTAGHRVNGGIMTAEEDRHAVF